MATNVQIGATIDYTNAGLVAIPYGQVVNLTTRIGVAGENIAVGATGSLHVTGVWEERCIAAAFAVGAALYWDPVALVITNVQAGNIPAGWCIETKPLNTLVAKVKIG